MTHTRRKTDQSKLAQFVDNPYTRLIHQVLSWLAPPAFGFIAWLGIHYTNDLETALSQNTKAISELTVKIENKIGSYDTHFINLDSRVTRLETQNDGRGP